MIIIQYTMEITQVPGIYFKSLIFAESYVVLKLYPKDRKKKIIKTYKNSLYMYK